jgi:hypothetical protein
MQPGDPVVPVFVILFLAFMFVMMNMLPLSLPNSDIIVITLYERINLNFYT